MINFTDYQVFIHIVRLIPLSVRLPETGLNTEYWVIEDYTDEVPPFWVITEYKECADCTTKGTSVSHLTGSISEIINNEKNYSSV